MICLQNIIDFLDWNLEVIATVEVLTVPDKLLHRQGVRVLLSVTIYILPVNLLICRRFTDSGNVKDPGFHLRNV